MNPLSLDPANTPSCYPDAAPNNPGAYYWKIYSDNAPEALQYYGKKIVYFSLNAQNIFQYRTSPILPHSLAKDKVLSLASKVLSLASSAFIEISCLAYCVGVYLTSSKEATPLHTKDPDKRRVPILLVHGYIHNNSAWGYMKNELHEAGHGPIYTINLKSFRSSIPEFAKQVQKRVQKIEKETGVKSIKLIGHSMGGVVCAYYTENLAKKGKVSHIVTIASPLKGTHIASFGIGKCAKQIRRHSPFTRSLIKKITQNTSTKYFHIASKVDVFILPYYSSLTGRDESRELLVEDRGHVSLMTFCPQVPETITRWLDDSEDIAEIL